MQCFLDGNTQLFVAPQLIYIRHNTTHQTKNVGTDVAKLLVFEIEF